jgi:selenocysteine lyase/cysteine desulfurase
MLSDKELARARALFPYVASGRIYLNHAGTSPLSTRVIEAMTGHLTDRSIGRLDSYSDDMKMMASCRDLVRRLINAESADRISLQPNTSEALNIVAAGLPWHAGDRVLLCSCEFPANVYPYISLRQYGVEIDFLECQDDRVTVEKIEQSLSPRTRLLALSAVQFLSGYRADCAAIGEMCRRKRAVFVVDGIQAVGAVRMDVRAMSIDALAAGCQKWQMGPHGGGFLYLTEELQSRIRQKHLGWLGVENPWDFSNFEQPVAPSARRYEGGTPTIPSLWGMHAALETLLAFGMVSIEDQVLEITRVLVSGIGDIPGLRLLTPTARTERAGIVTAKLPSGSDPRRVFSHLADAGVWAAVREGKLRLSPHFYNSEDEMLRTLEVLRRVTRNP